MAEDYKQKLSDKDNLLYDAWGVIANAGFTPGEEKTPGWHEAAKRWRDDFHAMLERERDHGSGY